MKDVLDATEQVFAEIYASLKEAAKALPPPDVSVLNSRSATQTVAAVAVDAGQSMFNGVLREIGVTLIRVSSSYPDEPSFTVPFWFNPYIPEDKARKHIGEQIQRIAAQVGYVAPFLNAVGWTDLEQHLPNEVQNLGEDALDFVRDLLEWATLYHVAIRLAQGIQINPAPQQGLVLRDGALRFAHTGQQISGQLSQAFENVGIPIIGLVKRSPVLRHPLIHYWLERHRKITLDLNEPFVVWIDETIFEKAGLRLQRYFGGNIRWGKYALVRLGAAPGNRHFFLADIPHYLYPDRSKVVSLLSNLILQTGATAFPWPGYPVPLAEAHRKVRIDHQTARLYESVLRSRLDSNSTELWRILLTLENYPERQE